MGKTSRWFRGLLGQKKSPAPSVAAEANPSPKEKKRWGFVRFARERDRSDLMCVSGHEIGVCMEESVVSNPSKHAIAVAAATAAVAEAAVAAAQAAAVVVELTSSSSRCPGAQVSAEREECAAVKIQAAFRGCLARRALRALKGLVKLQALVRGYIVRKQTVEALRCMQALVRVQSLVRAQSTGRSEKQTLFKGCSQSHPGPATPEKYERGIRPSSTRNPKSAALKRSTSKSDKMDENKMDFIDPDRMHVGKNFSSHFLDEQHWDPRETSKKVPPAVDKILEVDLGKPNFNSRRGNTNLPISHSFNAHNLAMLPESPSKDSMTAQLSFPSPSYLQLRSPGPLRIPVEVDDSVFDTAENSPQFYSASSKAASTRRGPFTPSKSACSQSFFSVYSDYPNYMADTESSRAKFRSHSAPKQRPKLEKSGSAKRLSASNKLGDGCRPSSQKPSSLHAKFTSKAYPGSGRLETLGMPAQEMAACNCNSRSRW